MLNNRMTMNQAIAWVMALSVAIVIAVPASADDNFVDVKEAEEKEAVTQPVDPQQKLQLIIERMRKTSDQIDQKTLGDKTQKLQVQSLADIDELIKLAESQKSSSQPQSSSMPQDQPPRKPSPSQQKPQSEKEGSKKPNANPGQSSDAASKPMESDPRNRQSKAARRSKRLARQFQADRIWGHLPQQLRKRLANVKYDEPLVKYRELVERYYESLATESSTRRSTNRPENGQKSR